VLEEQLGDPGAGEGVDEAEEDDEAETAMTERRRWTSIRFSPSVGVQRDEDEVDELDEDERDDDPPTP
jgi:hypothetical protein